MFIFITIDCNASVISDRKKCIKTYHKCFSDILKKMVTDKGKIPKYYKNCSNVLKQCEEKK